MKTPLLSIQAHHTCISSRPGIGKDLQAEISFDSDLDSCWSEDVEMHFLEEDFQDLGVMENRPHVHNSDSEEENVDDPGDPGDPGDPEDPEGPEHHQESSEDEEDEDSSDSDSEEENTGNFNFDHDSLQTVIQFEENRTVKESMLLDLALNIRHRQTYESLIEVFESKNVLLGRKFFPTSKRELWRLLGRNESGIVAHVYCHKCYCYIGRKRNLPEFYLCVCGLVIEVKKAKYFLTIDLKRQLEHFLSLPNVIALLRYREEREKLIDDAVEDVFDGEEYIRLQERVPMTEYDYTMVFNSDGVKLTKRAKTEVYPVYVRLNELPPHLRQKFIFLAAVFVDVVEPDMVSFLYPVILKLNKLSEEGIQWRPDGHEVVTSRFFTLCFCVDAKERWRMLHMTAHSGNYACTYCTFRGVRINQTMRYPALPHPNIPAYEDRTDEEMKADMIQAHRTHQRVRGHKGLTPLMLLRHFDLAHGAAADDLHNIYLCAAKAHTNLLLTVAPRVQRNMGYDTLCRIIDDRMKEMKTPSCISRKPGTCSITKRGQFTGTEWRNWTLYGAVPCLEGLIAPEYIRHFESLSRFAYILSQDVITPEDLNEADQCIRTYLVQFERYFGIEATRMNIHALPHAIRSCRDLGAYWVYSTFNFESWNNKIIRKITSPKGAILQIVVRHLIHMHLEMAMLGDPDVSEDIRAQLVNILTKKKKRLANARYIGNKVYLVGNPIQRQPTEPERAILLREGLDTPQLQVYKKILIRSTRYQAGHNVDVKSDNSRIYTFQDTFCTITNIVSFINRQGNELYGMFVNEHDVVQPRPFRVAKHIAQINQGNDIAHFIPIDHVKAPVVTVRSLGRLFMISLPNLNEID